MDEAAVQGQEDSGRGVLAATLLLGGLRGSPRLTCDEVHEHSRLRGRIRVYETRGLLWRELQSLPVRPGWLQGAGAFVVRGCGQNGASSTP